MLAPFVGSFSKESGGMTGGNCGLVARGWRERGGAEKVYVAGGEREDDDDGEEAVIGEDSDVCGLEDGTCADSSHALGEFSTVFRNGPGANSIGLIVPVCLSELELTLEEESVLRETGVGRGNERGGNRSARRRSRIVEF